MIILLFFLACVRVSSLASKVSLWGCGDISPSCRTRKQLQFEKKKKSHVNVNSYVFWENVKVYFIVNCRAGTCFWWPRKLRGAHSYYPPRRFQRKLQTLPPPPRWCGFNYMGRQGPALELTFDWFKTLDFNPIGRPAINPSNHGQWFCCHRPQFISRINWFSPLNSRWKTTFKRF